MKKDAPSPSYVTYKVKAGDNLSKISERFGNITIAAIKSLNQLESNVLTVGMLLKIAVP
ncbi:LysM peptidoglycan-binding domain-containing protein [Pelobium manganitolerans]|uniref:LysM peptidoglycan-binding domain-containing protein n=1 Tax=Pelobium manganitolerans TaxID=1842495 RepID=UPI000E752C5A|nr:LysM peptidoglycan-binding domain-containing protein [Pelobium manganitolerans]